jgi:hypothetical protein
MNYFFKELENSLEVIGKKENILGYYLCKKKSLLFQS